MGGEIPHDIVQPFSKFKNSNSEMVVGLSATDILLVWALRLLGV